MITNGALDDFIVMHTRLLFSSNELICIFTISGTEIICIFTS